MWLESSNHFDSCESLAGQPRQIISELTEQSKRIMDYGRSSKATILAQVGQLYSGVSGSFLHRR